MTHQFNDDSFPTLGLLPKQSTQALEFIQKYGHDGKNTLVAILDTGVDPAAPGLQVTTDNKVKLVDCIDCTGSGDVKLSNWIPVTKDLKSLSGKLIKLPAGIKDVKLGLKHSLELYPSDLWNRLKKQRQDTINSHHQQYLSESIVLLESVVSQLKTNNTKDLQVLKQEYQSRIDALEELSKSTDIDIWFDVVVYHSNNQYYAIIDKNGTCDFTNQIPLSQYSISHQFDAFSPDSKLTYSFNFYSNSNKCGTNDDDLVLSIVCVAGSHGSHVASITAGHFPEDPALNGVAPGAQLISLKIGDTRLGSMETSTGLYRACKALNDYKCDVANMSYGEACAIPDFGAFPTLLKSIINNKCIFVSSAGNAGPSLSSVGAPGGTTNQIISVGAHFSKDQLQSEYAMVIDNKQCTSGIYTWSSRGPTMDGDFGVSVYAPGSAITSIPKYNQSPYMLMNGTSMSSPNAAGCIALLVNAYKNKFNICPSPYAIKHALANSKVVIKDIPHNIPFMQVMDAWDQLINNNPIYNVFYNISPRGVYIHDTTTQVYTIPISINPVFFTLSDSDAFALKLVLVSNNNIVNHPKYLMLNNNTRTINVSINHDLLVNGLNSDVISAYKGDLLVFQIPITLIKPLTSTTKAVVSIKSSGVSPSYTYVKPSGSICTFSFKCKTLNTRYSIIVNQLVGDTKHTKYQHNYNTSTTNEYTFSVLINEILEITTSPWWQHQGDEIEWTMAFKDLSVVLDSVPIVPTLRISTNDKLTSTALKGNLNAKVIELMPINKEYTVLGSRDTIQFDDKQQNTTTTLVVNQLILEYETTLKTGKMTVNTEENGALYDSNYYGMLVMIYKGFKLVKTMDMLNRSFTWDGGLMKIRVEYRHTDINKLRQLNGKLSLDVSLDKEIGLEFKDKDGKSNNKIGLSNDASNYQVVITGEQDTATYKGSITIDKIVTDVLINHTKQSAPKFKDLQDKDMMGLVDGLVKKKIDKSTILKIIGGDNWYVQSQLVINGLAPEMGINYELLLNCMNGVENEYTLYKDAIIKGLKKELLGKMSSVVDLEKWQKLGKVESVEELEGIVTVLKKLEKYGMGLKLVQGYLKDANKLELKVYLLLKELVGLLKWVKWEERVDMLVLNDCRDGYLNF